MLHLRSDRRRCITCRGWFAYITIPGALIPALLVAWFGINQRRAVLEQISAWRASRLPLYRSLQRNAWDAAP